MKVVVNGPRFDRTTVSPSVVNVAVDAISGVALEDTVLTQPLNFGQSGRGFLLADISHLKYYFGLSLCMPNLILWSTDLSGALEQAWIVTI